MTNDFPFDLHFSFDTKLQSRFGKQRLRASHVVAPSHPAFARHFPEGMNGASFDGECQSESCAARDERPWPQGGDFEMKTLIEDVSCFLCRIQGACDLLLHSFPVAHTVHPQL